MSKVFRMSDPGYEMIAEYPVEFLVDGEMQTVDVVRFTTIVDVEGRKAYCKSEYPPAMIRQAREFGRYAYRDATERFRAMIGDAFTLPESLHSSMFEAVAKEVLPT